MNTKVNLAGVELKNPVMEASGTFGSGMEYSEFVDLNQLGAVVTKGVANVPWPGNPTPRIAEVYGGMLNAIGLQNPGIDVFCKRDIPFLKQYDTKIIVNVCGKSEEDYCEVVERLAEEPVDLLEINVSCPNVKEGAIAFGQKADALYNITAELKKHAKQPVITESSDNVREASDNDGKTVIREEGQASNEQIRQSVEKINKNMSNSEAIFGVHEATNRVMIKIVDKDTKEVIKEFPPEKTLDMIAKVWEMAGIMVDEKR